MGSLSLLQQIFPTQESNPGLMHCRRILYQLSYKGRAVFLSDHPILRPRQQAVMQPAVETCCLHSRSAGCLLIHFDHVLLSVTPWTVAQPGSSVHGISQVRVLAWVATPLPGDLPNQRSVLRLLSPASAGRFFTTSSAWKAPDSLPAPPLLLSPLHRETEVCRALSPTPHGAASHPPPAAPAL